VLIYLTGGSGFLGSNIIRVAQEKFNADVFAAVHSWQPSAPVGFSYGSVDLTDRDALFQSVRAFQPDVIIHSAILNDFASMYRDRKLAWRLYVEATRNLTDVANTVGTKIILVSTDWVFDGTQAGADESTPPNPINYYGVLKVACERVVAERGANWAVARVAGVNGVHWLRRGERQAQNAGFGHFATAVVQTLRLNEPFTVWLGEDINQRATPSLASDSAEMILKIARLDRQGIFHCTGGESIGRFNLAQRVAQLFGFDPALIQKGIHIDDLPQGARIPNDTSLSAVHTSLELDHPLLGMHTLLARFQREMDTGAI
jgi:dTDP-4-dehydrorhamnose reductase